MEIYIKLSSKSVQRHKIYRFKINSANDKMATIQIKPSQKNDQENANKLHPSWKFTLNYRPCQSIKCNIDINSPVTCVTHGNNLQPLLNIRRISNCGAHHWCLITWPTPSVQHPPRLSSKDMTYYSALSPRQWPTFVTQQKNITAHFIVLIWLLLENGDMEMTPNVCDHHYNASTITCCNKKNYHVTFSCTTLVV